VGAAGEAGEADRGGEGNSVPSFRDHPGSTSRACMSSGGPSPCASSKLESRSHTHSSSRLIARPSSISTLATASSSSANATLATTAAPTKFGTA